METEQHELRHELTPSQAKDILFAGKAIVTFQSVSGKWFTYKIIRKKSEKSEPVEKKLFFVSCLTGANNEVYSNYSYFGCVFLNGNEKQFKVTKKSKLDSTDPRVLAFQYTMYHLYRDNLTDVKIFHEGRCCRCGRRLTTPESVTNGIGPECIKNNKI